MAHLVLTPVFVGLRTGLHVLFVALSALVIARAVWPPASTGVAVVAVAIVFLITYGAGGHLARASGSRRPVASRAWLAVLTVEWVALLWLTPDSAYLVFPLFFLYVHVLGRRLGPVAVGGATVVAICGLGFHNGWSLAGIVGPTVGAAVAVVIGFGYQALAREAAERETLLAQLTATRNQLAASEHESGVLAERARLAREIHDTVAQGLSSIQLLLHAVERADPDCPGLEHLRLARSTAGTNLADTRRFIRELTPPDLDDHGLGGALRRLADTQWRHQGLQVTVRVSDSVHLPMHLQTALLRIAQGAIANVVQHAHAATATITLNRDDRSLRFTVADDGQGFDPARTAGEHPVTGRTDSFGLHATRERVDQFGGTLTVASAPGRGTTLTVDLPAEES